MRRSSYNAQHPHTDAASLQAPDPCGRTGERVAACGSPLVIGAVGGSGTRVLAQLVESAGVYLGAHRNDAGDAACFIEFYDRWIDGYLRGDIEWDGAAGRRMCLEFGACIERHLAARPPDRGFWGMKNPRSLLVLPFMHHLFPRMTFVHVIRNGLDMAYSANQRQVRLHGASLLTAEQQRHDTPGRAMAWWAAVNLAANEFGTTTMGTQYRLIRFEDLCRTPAETLQSTFYDMPALKTNFTESAVARVQRPKTIDRWKYRPGGQVRRLCRIGQQALARFGYGQGGNLDTDPPAATTGS